MFKVENNIQHNTTKKNKRLQHEQKNDKKNSLIEHQNKSKTERKLESQSKCKRRSTSEEREKCSKKMGGRSSKRSATTLKFHFKNQTQDSIALDLTRFDFSKM